MYSKMCIQNIRGVNYSILQVLYKAFYEYSIGHSTEYSIGYSIKCIQVAFCIVFYQAFLYSLLHSIR